MKPYAFGVDIGGTTIKMGFFSSDGKFIDHWEIPTRTENNGEMVLPDIARSIKKKLKQSELTLDDLEGVGVGVPGPVLPDGVVNKCVNLGWDVIDVRKQLSSLLDGVYVEVGNDANVAALGEQWNGGGKGHDNVVMVTLGTGVGGGIILGGKILAGSNGAAGEIGHMKVRDNETAVCGCGKKGCLEQYSSATGVVRLAKLSLAANPTVDTPLRSLDPLTAKDVFDYAKTGDEHGNACCECRADLAAAHVHEFRDEQAGENANSLEYEQIHAGSGGIVPDGSAYGWHPVGHGVEGG